MADQDSSPKLIFPCEFPLKVVGVEAEDFTTFVTAIVKKHVPNLNEREVTSRLSSNRKYRSISFQFTAESREQMDDLYRELTASERIKWVL